jgi:hypothetical protein
MDIRLLHPSDIPHVQHANITNLPEKYANPPNSFRIKVKADCHSAIL